MNGSTVWSNSGTGSILACIDFHGIAALIDTVAEAGPRHLSTLLQVLAASAQRLEARVVVELAVRCRDPLAPLGSRCRDALKAAADLELLESSPQWHSLRQMCPEARAGALLNLCDATLANKLPYSQARQRRCWAIRPRLKLAAIEESNARAGEILHLADQRKQRCPEYWQLLETFSARALRVSEPLREHTGVEP